MKFNGILTLVVTVLAVVLISTACIIPVVQSAQSEQRSIENNSSYLYSMVMPEVLDITKVYEEGSTTPIGLVINGYQVDYPTTSSRAIVVGSDFIVEAYTNSNVQIFGIDSETNESYSGGFTALHIENGTISITATVSSTHATNTDFMYVIADKGDYCEATMLDGLNIDPDANIIVCGDTTLTATGYTDVRARYVFSGTIESYETIMMMSTTNGIASSPSATPTVSEVEGQPYLNIKGDTTLKGTFTVSDESVEFSYTGTNVRVIAPVEYTIISDNDSMIIALLGIIPVLLFVIPIMLIVRSFGVGRD